MKLDLSDIARIPGSSADHEIEMSFAEMEGMTLTAPVRGKLTVSSTGTVLLLNGHVETEVETACNRCGLLYRQPVHAEIQEDFALRQAAPGRGLRVEEEEAPESRVFVAGTLDLDLDELLRQSILVALPLNPLCDKLCKGLCPHCGKRLEGEEVCSCEPDAIDPRMAELARLLEQPVEGLPSGPIPDCIGDQVERREHH